MHRRTHARIHTSTHPLHLHRRTDAPTHRRTLAQVATKVLEQLRTFVRDRGVAVPGDLWRRQLRTVVFSCSVADERAIGAADGVIVMGNPLGGATLVRTDDLPVKTGEEGRAQLVRERVLALVGVAGDHHAEAEEEQADSFTRSGSPDSFTQQTESFTRTASGRAQRRTGASRRESTDDFALPSVMTSTAAQAAAGATWSFAAMLNAAGSGGSTSARGKGHSRSSTRHHSIDYASLF